MQAGKADRGDRSMAGIGFGSAAARRKLEPGPVTDKLKGGAISTPGSTRCGLAIGLRGDWLRSNSNRA